MNIYINELEYKLTKCYENERAQRPSSNLFAAKLEGIDFNNNLYSQKITNTKEFCEKTFMDKFLKRLRLDKFDKLKKFASKKYKISKNN